MYQIWAQMFHKNNNFNLRCTFCEKKALHIKNIRAPKFWRRQGSYGWRHNIRKVYASPPPLQLFTSGITNLFSTNVDITYQFLCHFNARIVFFDRRTFIRPTGESSWDITWSQYQNQFITTVITLLWHRAL